MKKRLADLWQKFNQLGKKKFIILVILLLAIGFGVWRLRSVQINQQAAQPQTVEVVQGPLIVILSASGQAVQTNLAAVVTKATGVVKRVYITDGQTVQAGDKIAEIELDSAGKLSQTQAWTSYLSAKNSLASAQNQQYTLESAMWKAHEAFEADALDTELSVDDPIYIQRQRDWLAAEASYKNQQRVVVQQQSSVSNAWQSYQQYSSVITAPVGGVIKGMNVAEGMVLASTATGTDTAGSSQTIATVGADSKPIVSVAVTEVDVSKVQTGQQATVTFDGLPEDSFTGTVVSIDRVGSTTSGVTQYPVLIQLDAASENILPNMAAVVDIILDSKQAALQIPLSALTAQGETSTVQVLRDGQYQVVTVETGLETDTMVEIVSGLSAGDQVVTNTISSSANTPSNQGPSTNFSFGGGGGGMIRTP